VACARAAIFGWGKKVKKRSAFLFSFLFLFFYFLFFLFSFFFFSFIIVVLYAASLKTSADNATKGPVFQCALGPLVLAADSCTETNLRFAALEHSLRALIALVALAAAPTPPLAQLSAPSALGTAAWTSR
jgi:hypothetical protein